VRTSKEDDLRAELEQQIQRDEARRRLNDLQQLQKADHSGARSSSSGVRN